MTEKKFGAITSSVNAEDISNRVKGFTLAMSSIIILVAVKLFGIQLQAQDVASLASELGAVSGAVWVIYGFGMKAWSYFFKK